MENKIELTEEEVAEILTEIDEIENTIEELKIAIAKMPKIWYH